MLKKPGSAPGRFVASDPNSRRVPSALIDVRSVPGDALDDDPGQGKIREGDRHRARDLQDQRRIT
jgi:hypothetical protein